MLASEIKVGRPEVSPKKDSVQIKVVVPKKEAGRPEQISPEVEAGQPEV